MLSHKRLIEGILILLEVVCYVMAAVDIFYLAPGTFLSIWIVIGVVLLLVFAAFEVVAAKKKKHAK